MTELLLYGVPQSSFVRTTRMALMERGLYRRRAGLRR